MSITGIIIATVIVGGVGVFIGLFLGAAGEKFKVETDEREEAVRELLPGNNCGGCGYAGCDAMAAAIVAGEAPVNGCPVGGAPVGEKIAGCHGCGGRRDEEDDRVCQMRGYLRDCSKGIRIFGSRRLPFCEHDAEWRRQGLRVRMPGIWLLCEGL